MYQPPAMESVFQTPVVVAVEVFNGDGTANGKQVGERTERTIVVDLRACSALCCAAI